MLQRQTTGLNTIPWPKKLDHYNRALKVPENQMFIIPIRIEDCEPHFKELSKIHYFDMFVDYHDCLSMLIRAFEYGEKEKLSISYIEKFSRIGVIHSVFNGFGFVETVDSNLRPLYHRNELHGLVFEDLDVGDKVSFILAENPKGLIATKLSKP